MHEYSPTVLALAIIGKPFDPAKSYRADLQTLREAPTRKLIALSCTSLPTHLPYPTTTLGSLD